MLTFDRLYFHHATMSGHPHQGQYDEDYGHPQHSNTDSYYQDDQHAQPYYDHNGGYAAEHGSQHMQQGADGYYDESYVLPNLDVSLRNELTVSAVGITMLMPTIRTSKMEVTTRAMTMVELIRMSTTMVSTMIRAPRVNTKATAIRKERAAVTRKRSRRPSVILL
jgi:hypothetical protein